ncbi:oxidoreductase [Pseudomonas frederiksbergensis]|uniref:Oxidoreductase n=2 Tax=Pseudomonas frederiksbergensis TaxID=104087 RepID=A0A2S8HW99_9PSED|nr:oxidoreductase [Pseudomonas frederiksbergensis]
MAFVFSSQAAADCAFNNNNISGTIPQTHTMNYGSKLTGGLSVPQDASIGTVIYQETISTTGDQSFGCTGPTLYGFVLNPELGSVTSGTTFPLGKTGLSFRIHREKDQDYLAAATVALNASPYYVMPAGNYRLEIIKSGELASENSIPAGYLGQYLAGDAVFGKYYLINPITLNTASCKTPAVSVQMGDDYLLNEFDKSGDTPRVIKFNIALNQCQRGIKKVNYQLKATTKVIDSTKGIVALNAESTAKGIGLQLMNDAGQPIALDTVYPFNGFNTTDTDFKIPLSAAYYRLAEGTLQGGTANTAITFIVSYL